MEQVVTQDADLLGLFTEAGSCPVSLLHLAPKQSTFSNRHELVTVECVNFQVMDVSTRQVDRMWLSKRLASSLLTLITALLLCGSAAQASIPLSTDHSELASVKVQERKAQKRAPLVPPKRTIAVQSMDVKLTKGSSPTGFSVGFGAGNTSGGGSQRDGEILISDALSFAEGVGGVLITSLNDSKAFVVLDLPISASSSGLSGAPPPTDASDASDKPELVIRAVITDMSCRLRSGGLSVGDLSGGQGQYENKVTMDVRLVDPVTNVVVDSVKATGKKTSKSSIFSATKWKHGSYLDPATKVLDLSFGDFEDSPLAEATRLATEDAVKKLIEKARSRPWEARVIKIVQEGDATELYLNVGPESGLQVGDSLELIRLGEVIKDSKSGRAMGRMKSKVLGKVTVTERSDDFMICRPAADVSATELENPDDLVVRELKG